MQMCIKLIKQYFCKLCSMKILFLTAWRPLITFYILIKPLISSLDTDVGKPSMESRAKTLFLPARVDIKDDSRQGNMHGSLPSVKAPNNNILFELTIFLVKSATNGSF